MVAHDDDEPVLRNVFAHGKTFANGLGSIDCLYKSKAEALAADERCRALRRARKAAMAVIAARDAFRDRLLAISLAVVLAAAVVHTASNFIADLKYAAGGSP